MQPLRRPNVVYDFYASSLTRTALLFFIPIAIAGVLFLPLWMMNVWLNYDLSWLRNTAFDWPHLLLTLFFASGTLYGLSGLIFNFRQALAKQNLFIAMDYRRFFETKSRVRADLPFFILLLMFSGMLFLSLKIYLR